MTAENVSDFYKRLENENLLCLEFKEATVQAEKVKTIYRMKTKDLVLFCRKLSTMLAAGMSITNALDIMSSSTNIVKQNKLFMSLYEAIKGGRSLSAAMSASGNAFPPLLINMIESGEESGNIDLMCAKLAVYYEKQQKTQSKIKTATTYPKLLAVAVVGVVIILFTFVLPNIVSVFQNMELPLITRIIMGMSNFMVRQWYIVVTVIVLFIVLIRLLFLRPEFKMAWGRAILYMPKVGVMLRKIYSARFANTLSILYASGLTLLNAIRLSVRVIGNSYIEYKLLGVLETVSTGNSLSDAVDEIHVFDKLLSSMIRIGEETGSLDTILNTVSEYYEEETESAIESLLAMLEPLMLILMAGIIGTILVAVMLPIYTGYGTIG